MHYQLFTVTNHLWLARSCMQCMHFLFDSLHFRLLLCKQHTQTNTQHLCALKFDNDALTTEQRIKEENRQRSHANRMNIWEHFMYSYWFTVSSFFSVCLIYPVPLCTSICVLLICTNFFFFVHNGASFTNENTQEKGNWELKVEKENSMKWKKL